jgi:hypothetical protein
MHTVGRNTTLLDSHLCCFNGTNIRQYFVIYLCLAISSTPAELTVINGTRQKEGTHVEGDDGEKGTGGEEEKLIYNVGWNRTNITSKRVHEVTADVAWAAPMVDVILFNQHDSGSTTGTTPLVEVPSDLNHPHTRIRQRRERASRQVDPACLASRAQVLYVDGDRGPIDCAVHNQWASGDGRERRTLNIDVLATVRTVGVVSAVQRNGKVGVLDRVPARAEVASGVVEGR